MAKSAGRPGVSDKVPRKSERVGPGYSDEMYRNPYNGDNLESQYTAGDDKKTLVSPNATTVTGNDMPLHKDYNEYWEDGR